MKREEDVQRGDMAAGCWGLHLQYKSRGSKGMFGAWLL